MTSIVKLTALSGAKDDSPPCFLLQIDEYNILLDCGWDERLSTGLIERITPRIPQIDCVLITYPDFAHLGALPYLVGKLKLECEIYATVPVYKMGQMFMYDMFQSRNNYEDFNLFSLDDIDNAFEKITQVKYQEPISLKGKGEGLTIVAYPAGHLVGGAIWKITKDGEEDVVYAVDYNHKRERHLNGCTMDVMSRSHILITDAVNGCYFPEKRPVRDEKLTVNIMSTLRERGNVLICIDTAGRVLEMAQLLDNLWKNEESGLNQYSLAFLSNMSYNVLEFAKSQMEWMSDRLMSQFESDRTNPFAFKYLKPCHSLQDLTKLTDPKVVLATQPDLQSGFAKDLFVQWCQDPKNCVIFTQRTGQGTLARLLIDRPETKAVAIDVKKRVPLEGTELEQYLAKKEKEANSSQGISLEESMEIDDDGTDDDEMAGRRRHLGDSSDEENEEVLIEKLWKNRSRDFYVDTDCNKPSVFKPTKKSHVMFPHRDRVIKWDDYGEIINPDEFCDPDLIAKERENVVEEHMNVVDMPGIEEKPTKCVFEKKSLKIKCKHAFIDYEGRSDGDSVKKIIAHCKPRQLILVRSSEASAKAVVDYCLNDAKVQLSALIPKYGETVDATLESFIYQVKLTDNLMAGLDWNKVKGIELTWVDGVIAGEDEKEFQDSSDMYSGQERDPSKVPLLQKATDMKIASASSHDTVFVNEVRLNEFKLILTKNGLSAEFIMGVLVVNGKVAIKRLKSGHISIEGCLCEEYYQVRELLYQQFAVL